MHPASCVGILRTISKEERQDKIDRTLADSPQEHQGIDTNQSLYLFRDVAQLVARVLWEHDVAGSNPVIPTISSVHNTSELWTLDFFLLMFTFSLIFSLIFKFLSSFPALFCFSFCFCFRSFICLYRRREILYCHALP